MSQSSESSTKLVGAVNPMLKSKSLLGLSSVELLVVTDQVPLYVFEPLVAIKALLDANVKL